MATRSIISTTINGRTVGVYVHWDGSPKTRIPLLLNHYNSQELAQAIVSLGAISSLGERLAPNEGEEHSFENPAKGVTVAYHRDRVEDFEQIDFEQIDINSKDIPSWCEWIYHFKNGKWRYRSADKKTWMICK